LQYKPSLAILSIEFRFFAARTCRPDGMKKNAFPSLVAILKAFFFSRRQAAKRFLSCWLLMRFSVRTMPAMQALTALTSLQFFFPDAAPNLVPHNERHRQKPLFMRS